MKTIVLISTLAVLAGAQTRVGNGRPTLSKGTISYLAVNGQRAEIRVGKKCLDLWVSPDESMIAFIAVEKSLFHTENEEEPFIEQSSIYIARRSDHFTPVRIPLKGVVIDGRSWTVFRAPSVSPNLKTVYFSVPNTMTTWRLMSVPLHGEAYGMFGDEVSYCVVWGGKHSGDLLTLERDQGAVGPTYGCYLRDQSGSRTLVANEQECIGFDDFAVRWSKEQGGACTTMDGEDGPAAANAKRRTTTNGRRR
jgi:hypothetical protein